MFDDLIVEKKCEKEKEIPTYDIWYPTTGFIRKNKDTSCVSCPSGSAGHVGVSGVSGCCGASGTKV